MSAEPGRPSTSFASFLPTHIETDATLRVKILDACGMTCTFCHNEGTPVVVDNRNRGLIPFKPTELRTDIDIRRHQRLQLPTEHHPSR